MMSLMSRICFCHRHRISLYAFKAAVKLIAHYPFILKKVDALRLLSYSSFLSLEICYLFIFYHKNIRSNSYFEAKYFKHDCKQH